MVKKKKKKGSGGWGERERERKERPRTCNIEEIMNQLGPIAENKDAERNRIEMGLCEKEEEG